MHTSPTRNEKEEEGKEEEGKEEAGKEEAGKEEGGKEEERISTCDINPRVTIKGHREVLLLPHLLHTHTFSEKTLY